MRIDGSACRFFRNLLFHTDCSFQFVNVIVLLFETLYYYIPNIWIVFAIVLWEGLLGGGAYVNTFYRMSTEVMRPFYEFLKKNKRAISATSENIKILMCEMILKSLKSLVRRSRKWIAKPLWESRRWLTPLASRWRDGCLCHCTMLFASYRSRRD